MLTCVDTRNDNALVFANVEAFHDLARRYFSYRRIAYGRIGVSLKHTLCCLDTAFADRLGCEVFFGNRLKRVFVLARILAFLIRPVFCRVDSLLNKQPRLFSFLTRFG